MEKMYKADRFVKIFLSGFLLWVLALASLSAGIKFSDTKWDFGILKSQEVVQSMDLLAENTGNEAITLTISPTCNCLTVSPAEEVSIEPGKIAYFKLFYDPFEDVGVVERNYLIRTSVPGMETSLFVVFGYVDVGASEGEADTVVPVDNPEPEGDYDVSIIYYYSPTCPKCRKFIRTTVPSLEKELGIKIGFYTRSVNELANLNEMTARLKKMGVKEGEIPVLVIGEKVFQGTAEIDLHFKKDLIRALKSGVKTDTGMIDTTGVDVLKRNLTILPVLGAGLIDGINPCAFATIIMLLSALALAGKRRREVLIMGIFFTLSVFVTYFLAGVGAFIGIQAAHGFPVVAVVIKWVFFAALQVFAVLSIYDYMKIKAGKLNEMVLQLNDTFKKKIKNSIHKQARSAALVGSSLLLGFLVSIFELGCTGQVYLPTIVAMVRVGDNLWGIIFLLIYCLGFIAPLVVVFAVTYRGLSTKKVIDLFKSRMGAVKISLAVLFEVLAVLTVIL